MRKPGKVLSIIGLILSAALLVVGSYFILPRSQNWAHMERAHRQRRGVLCLLCVPQKR